MTLRAGVIGLGVGEQHIVGFDAHPACVTAAICDIDSSKLDEVGSRHPAATRTIDPDDVLDDPSIDVVAIASHDDAHVTQVIRAIEHGKHVFAEKPLCINAGELAAIEAALAANPDVRLTSNLVLRAHPRFRQIRELIQGGELGRVYHVEAAYLYGRIAKLLDGWRGDIPDYSVMLGGGVHMIDLVLWLTGERVVEVQAMSSGAASRAMNPERDVVDFTAALLRFDSGGAATITANFACARPHFHALTVCGTDGTIVNEPDAPKLYTSRDPEVAPRRLPAGEKPAKGALIASFVDAILGSGVNPVPEDEVFEALRVGFAVDDAARAASVTGE